MKVVLISLMLVGLVAPVAAQEGLSGFEGSGVLRRDLRQIRAAKLREMRAGFVAPKEPADVPGRVATPPPVDADASAAEAVRSVIEAGPADRVERILEAYRVSRQLIVADGQRAAAAVGDPAESEAGVLLPDEEILQAWVDGELSAKEASAGAAESVDRMFELGKVDNQDPLAERKLEAEVVAALTQAWVSVLQEAVEPELQERFDFLARSGVVDFTTVEQSIGADSARSRSLATVNNLLPVPNDVNDPFVSKVVPGESALGQAEYLRLLGSDSSKSIENTAVRFRELAWFGVLFNTSGMSGLSYDPATVSLSGSKVQGAGQTQFFDNGKEATLDLNLAFDAQNRKLFGEDIQGQFYVEGNNFNETSELKFDDLYFRGWNKGNWSITAGKTDSLFEGDGNLQPLGLSGKGVLTGSPVYREGIAVNNRSQLRISYNEGVDSWQLAIEDPVRDQWTVAGVQELTRWPALTSKVKTKQEVLFGQELSLQFSGLVRTMDGETAGLREYHDLAWGVGAFASLAQDRGQTFFAGVSGGRGVGSYINGVSAAAAGDVAADSFRGLGGLGAYVGSQHSLFEIGSDSSGYRAVAMNIGYGIAITENSVWLAQGQTNRTVQQGVINLILPLSEHLMTGLEYQYAGREVFSGNNGENHQVMAIVAIQGNKKGKAVEDSAKQARRAELIADQLNSFGTRSFSAADVQSRSGADVVEAFQQAL